MLKISELAKKVNVRVSTIRHYIDVGLILPTERTESNYMLFDDATLEKLRTIRELREKERLTINEIKEYFKKQLGG